LKLSGKGEDLKEGLAHFLNAPLEIIRRGGGKKEGLAPLLNAP
jgi:hypothetical protein